MGGKDRLGRQGMEWSYLRPAPKLIKSSEITLVKGGLKHAYQCSRAGDHRSYGATRSLAGGKSRTSLSEGACFE